MVHFLENYAVVYTSSNIILRNNILLNTNTGYHCFTLHISIQ